ncbi:calcium-binding protein [Tateyamaria sp. syn59]|uniref:calcium-binding protein n=1 Tax=Tateyamaria sp. syn59 TaxID=2576942 RepID=UPI0011BE4C4B|nr:calcium-binding protein [Tateyamaria sp. syn59]
MTKATVGRGPQDTSKLDGGVKFSPKDRVHQDSYGLRNCELEFQDGWPIILWNDVVLNLLGTFEPLSVQSVDLISSNDFLQAGFSDVPEAESVVEMDMLYTSMDFAFLTASDNSFQSTNEQVSQASFEFADSPGASRSLADEATDAPQYLIGNMAATDTAATYGSNLHISATTTVRSLSTSAVDGTSEPQDINGGVEKSVFDLSPAEDTTVVSRRDMSLLEINDYNLHVSEKHFGGNVLYTRNTVDGTPSDDFLDAVDYLDITYQRYPAGQPDVAYIDGVIVDGYLPDNLVNFLTAAREQGFKVLVVTPTHAAYTNAEDVGRFAELIARDFGDVLHAFEIGNEYWNHQTETSYGQVANDSVLAIADALDGLGVDYPIWVQMGDAGGWESEFHTRNDDRGWLTRTIEANNTVIKQISDEAFKKIDGVVEHFYLRDGGGQFIQVDNLNDQMISLDFAIWQNYLNEDATLNITEWNIRTSNLDQLGIRAASSLIAHFTHIVELGADEAYLWPPHLNTSSDLAGSGEVIVDTETGIVINSVGGAVFDLMSSSLPGLEYLSSATSSSSSRVLHHLYGSDEKVVVYLSSRSEFIEEVSYSLGGLFEGFSLTSAIKIGYDHSTSDGRHFNYRTRSWDESKKITVNGQDYVINEHDVRASVEVLNHTQVEVDGKFTVELLPYQVVELAFTLPSYNEILGTAQIDVIEGTSSDDLVNLFGGNDSVTTGGGADTIYGGNGADFLNSGSGSDSVFGGKGNDSLRGWGGNDSLYGGDGHDNIQGSFGKDSLEGGSGDDFLDGGQWHDTLDGGDGNDTLIGGDGNDVLRGGDGRNELNGNAGNDVIFVTSGVDTVFGGSGDDTLSLAEFNEGVTIWTRQEIVETDRGKVVFSGVESLVGTSHADRFIITSNNMDLDGGEGNDVFQIIGGERLRVSSGFGNDLIHIYGGSQIEIHAGVGDDTIISHNAGGDFWGGVGADEITLRNETRDRVYFSKDDGADSVFGFNSAQDELIIDAALSSQVDVTVKGDGTVLDFSGGDKIVLYGVFDFLQSEDLIFV